MSDHDCNRAADGIKRQTRGQTSSGRQHEQL